MGPLARFLLALNRLARARGFKIEDAYKFAKQEFGEITPLLRKQIQNVFDKIKKPAIGKPGKKEGTVLPFIKETGKEPKGLETLDEFPDTRDNPLQPFDKDIVEGETRLSGLSDAEESEIADLLEQEMKKGETQFPKNVKRPGGALDPTLGLTRTMVRRILQRKNIEVGKKDPIDVFDQTFGTDTAIDVKNLADELLEMEAMGKTPKDLDTILQQEGLFDIDIPKNPAQGMTDEELFDLVKKTDEEEVLKDFDPKGRKPNATGGRAQAASGGLASILNL